MEQLITIPELPGRKFKRVYKPKGAKSVCQLCALNNNTCSERNFTDYIQYCMNITDYSLSTNYYLQEVKQ